MPIFGGKENNVFKAIDEHLDAVGLTIKKLWELMETYLAGDIEKAEVLMKEVEDQERVADELRREIEAMLYQGALNILLLS